MFPKKPTTTLPLRATGCAILINLLLLNPSSNAQEPLAEEATAATDSLGSVRDAVDLVQDSNIAESVARRPELKFANITIDGERSNLSLSSIPADAVNELEVMKAATPDLDADARGGSLNLTSQPGYQLNRPIRKAELSTLYSAKEGTWEYRANATYGQAFGGRIGMRITASYENINDRAEDWVVDWKSLSGDQDPKVPSKVFYFRNEFWRERSGVNGTLDFLLTPTLSAYFRFNHLQQRNAGHEPALLFQFEDGRHQSLENGRWQVESASVERNLQQWENHFRQSDFQIGGTLNLDPWKLDLRWYDEGWKVEEPDRMNLQFTRAPATVHYTQNSGGMPKIEVSPEDSDPAAFHFEEWQMQRFNDGSDRRIGTMNLRRNFSIGEVSGYWKSGIKRTENQKAQVTASQIHTGTADAQPLLMGQLEQRSSVQSLIRNHFHFGPFPDPNLARAYFSNEAQLLDPDLTRSRLKSDPGTYEVSELIEAAYSMIDLRFRNLRGIAGFRYEQTRLDFKANEVVIDALGAYERTRQTEGSNRYRELFPSFHLRYTLSPNLTAHASWTGSIKRPWYGSVVPYRFVNHDSREINEGNPLLRPTLYNNLDAALDYSYREDGMLSIEAFHREVEDLVFWSTTELQDGPFKGFKKGSNENGPSATESGWRLILNQELESVWDRLTGWSLMIKYTQQQTQTTYPDRPQEPMPVTYRPKHTTEATLSYNHAQYFMQLMLLNFSGELHAVNTEAWKDLRQEPVTTLNLSASYQINDRTRLFMDLFNLTRSQYRRYYGDPSRPFGESWNSRRIQLGLRFNL
jgi:TonB-dependent receptor